MKPKTVSNRRVRKHKIRGRKLGKRPGPKPHRKNKSKAAPPKGPTGKAQRSRRNGTVPGRTRNQPLDPRVARALGLMRRDGFSASRAAREEGMKLETFRKSAGRFLYRSGPGKPWKARSEDQLAFSLELLTPQGRVSVIVRSSRERKLLYEYENALRMFRGAEDGAEEKLKKFEGKTVGGHRLVTDTRVIEELEQAGEVDFDNFYTAVGGKP